MKMITAMIQPEVLPMVEEELFSAQIKRFSVTAAVGHGTRKGYTATFGGVQMQVDVLKHARVDVAVNEDYVDRAVAAILRGARVSGEGEGKIFITDLHDCIRIRTGQRGAQAVG